ncbi:uncharacterized protein [Lepeophtheirus salmonis]|uniref:uncharacterized protein n=1 Tax=Lepeophtheirus salmonis TaxID=72036 RepID=UPI001AE45202|nr:uncharacterized protein LOC121123212 [Lepeophtheirus salmonis]
MTSKIICAVLVFASLVNLNEAGFRCFFGDWACTAGCTVMGQTSGICGHDGKCWCSERRISIKNFKALLPSRCTLGEEFCNATCQSIGRVNGTCAYNDCSCADELISPDELALCTIESNCNVYCQGSGRAGGECRGWSCVCTSRN